jgi:hypothetical protein
MVKRSLIIVASAACLASCGGQSNAGKETAAEAITHVKAHGIKELMQQVMEPQAQLFWHSAGTITDETGEHDLSPTTDEGWQATRSAAATVTEMGNLMMTPQYAEGRGKDWLQFSKSLVEIGMKAEKAAADRNSDAIFETGGIMYRVCSSCHLVYMPKEPTPDAATNKPA